VIPKGGDRFSEKIVLKGKIQILPKTAAHIRPNAQDIAQVVGSSSFAATNRPRGGR
jgi:hypothetical protein